MKKIYVIIANDIHVIGGEEIYIYGKAKYLESEGWEVKVLFPGENKGRCKIDFLNKYLGGGIKGLCCLPYNMQDDYREYILKQMLNHIDGGKSDEIIIETHTDVYAFWGELLAECVEGKHYVFCLSELYRELGNSYESNLDFFKFKLDRNELIASEKSVQLLFDGYKNIVKSKIEYPLLVMEADPIQDIADGRLNEINSGDYNICSVGRMDKPYISYAIKGIKEFAHLHRKSKISFIVVGDERNVCEELFSAEENVDVINLGILFPIPRKLFSVVDVVIAAAQTAQFVAYENVLTIVANVLNDTTPGVLGIDTLDSWYGGGIEPKTYREVLEDVLIFHKYKVEDVKMPVRKPAEYYYALQWKYLSLSAKTKEYCTKRLMLPRKKWLALFPYWAVEKNSRILIYGAGKVGQDYYRQVCATNYCHISGVVDKNAFKYDDVVVPEIGLIKLDYDVVIIAVYSNEVAEEIKKMVINLVKGKTIIHDIKCITVE